MPDGSPRFTRRRLLALVAAAGVSACAGRDVGDEPGASPATASPRPSPRPAEPQVDPRRELAAREPADVAPEPLPRPEPYEPLAGETYPGAKRIAARAAQQLTTYEPGADFAAVVAAAAPAEPDLGALRAATAPLHHDGVQSTGEVVYAQLGGLAPWTDARRCSVMVVVRQRMQDARGDVVDHTRTVDVRLGVTGGDWLVETVGDVGGEPVPRPDDLSDEAAAVLDDERIDLPDSARWDIHRGVVDERLLAAMRTIADLAPYRVSSLVSGHPVHVFGTDNVSNHMFGKAVDIWAVDGTPVVVDQPDTDTATHRLARGVFDDRVVPSIGGPWAFDGHGGRSFADPVHVDHLHVAFHASPESRAGFTVD